MPLNLSAVGQESEPYEHEWTSKDTLLYAVGVGAGLGEPLEELAFTTENSEGIEQQVLPTFAVIAARSGGGRSWGEIDFSKLVHAEQGFELHRPLPAAGKVKTTSKVTGMYDKGSGALIVTEGTAVDPDTGEKVITTYSSAFVRGEGGFGGDRGPKSDWAKPDRAPDHKVTYATRPEQALVYRLSGDRNPLHVDPKFAGRGGFDRPILHGLCTYGVTGRALLHTLAGSDPARFAAMSGRFSSPVWPGESLTVSMWVDAGGPGVSFFQTAKDDGTVVLDQGRVTVRPA